MKIYTSELIDQALDYAVAKCEWGHRYTSNADISLIAVRQAYSTDRAQGGPIIEREGIATSPSAAGLDSWVADLPLKPTSFADKTRCSGPTPLIAAMRCYVRSRLGDKVEIPEELK
jgi:hypothetical protein